jgi:hypothetical protein
LLKNVNKIIIIYKYNIQIMKKIITSIALFSLFSTTVAIAQSDKVGYINEDGVFVMTVPEVQGKNILKQLSIPTEAQPFNATEVMLTVMDDGSISLTGYSKTPSGNIIKGFRVQCFQDDENNLIVAPGHKRERIVGKPF